MFDLRNRQVRKTRSPRTTVWSWVLLQTAEAVKLEQTTRVFDDVYYSGSPEAFTYIIGRAKEGEAVRGYAGYAGWAPGQLEREINEGSWIVVPVSADLVLAQLGCIVVRFGNRAGQSQVIYRALQHQPEKCPALCA